jgi:hypothetical protein
MKVSDLGPMRAWKQFFAGLLGRLRRHEPPPQLTEEHEIVRRLRELMEPEGIPVGSQSEQAKFSQGQDPDLLGRRPTASVGDQIWPTRKRQAS